MNTLIIGATGLFGSRLCELLAHDDHDIFAVTRDPEVARDLTTWGVTGVVADLDDPDTLRIPMKDADRVFLASPIHPDLGVREAQTIEIASRSGVQQLVKIHGAVRHDDDELGRQHRIAIDALQASDLEWTLLSPSSVMETTLLPQADAVRHLDRMFGCAGQGRVGLIAADDVALAAATLLRSDPELMHGRNLEITGPEAFTHAGIADRLGSELGRTIGYTDLSEDEFRDLLIDFGVDADTIDIRFLCHFRAIREGRADLVNNTFEWLVGRPPMSISDWLGEHRRAFLPINPVFRTPSLAGV